MISTTVNGAKYLTKFGLKEYCIGGGWGAFAAVANKIAFMPNTTGFISSWIARACLFAIGLYCNAKVLASLANLLLTVSALKATLALFAVNTIFSGALGRLIFNDQLSCRWLTGAVFLILGLWCMSDESSAASKTAAAATKGGDGSSNP